MIDRRRLIHPSAVSVWAVALLAVLGACLPGVAPAGEPAIRPPAPPSSPVMATSPALAPGSRLAAAGRGRSTMPERRPPAAWPVGLWLVPPPAAVRTRRSFFRVVTLP